MEAEGPSEPRPFFRRKDANLEIGALIKDPVFLTTVVNYIDALISNEVLSPASGVTPVSLPLSIHSRPFESLGVRVPP